MTPSTRYSQEFFDRAAEDVARDLLRSLLVHGETSGRIVETEAYGGEEDPGSHASAGSTPRNRTMYGPPGRAYVYVCYGIHDMVNVVTGPEGEPGAVLIRALKPLSGVQKMRERRGQERVEELASGPGKLAEALDISKEHDGKPLTEGQLRLEPGENVPKKNVNRLGVKPRGTRPAPPVDVLRSVVDESHFDLVVVDHRPYVVCQSVGDYGSTDAASDHNNSFHSYFTLTYMLQYPSFWLCCNFFEA